MRAALFAAVFVSLATAAVAENGGTPPHAAPPAKQQQQQQQPATSGMGAPPEAPVGHRQPTQKSLPPQLRKDEAAPRAPDPLGPLPKICEGC